MTDNEYEALDSGQMSIDSSTMDAQTSQWSTSWTQGLTAGSNGTTSIDLSSITATQPVLGGTWGPGAVGSPYTITTTTNTGGIQWQQSPYALDDQGKMSITGEKADIEINGKSMSAWMAKVEERLNILTPNLELEKEWDELRRLGERYRKLEKKCKEKAEMWKQLKKMPAPRPDQF